MTKVADVLARGRSFSFEFFPPKNDAEHGALVRTLRELEPLEPSFVSVTYRGGRESRERTHDLVAGMLRTTSLNPMAHLVCVAHTRLELAEILVNFRKAGIENLMALGGDPPTGEPAPGELTHAIELVELARAIGGFSVGVAAHPIGHPRATSLDDDRGHLATKLRAADFAITQFFFEAEDYLRLVDDLAARGVDKPVLPGIMPVTTLASIPRMAQMGAPVPASLADRLESAGDEEAVRRAGIDAATELCDRLLAEGAPGLHFYTLNRSTATREIHAALGLTAST
jgi:methylenetetrahydrofolate reductase (NADPH)